MSQTKIPYDPSPISRDAGGGGGTSSYKQKHSAPVKRGNKSKLVGAIVIVALVVVALVGGYLLGGRLNKPGGGDQTLNLNYNVNTTSKDVSIPASKAKLSSVVIGNGGSDERGNSFSASNLPSYSELLSNTSNQGAGIIYSIDKQRGEAYIITCEHVVRGFSNTKPVFVCVYDSLTAMAAEVVGAVQSQDIAVLKISGDQLKSSKITAATLADSSYVAEGDKIFAVGNALMHGFSVQDGIISTPSISITAGETRNIRTIQINANINGGNSGGGLFNKNGELLGIVKAKSNDDINNGVFIEGTAYALPINRVVSIAQNIINNQGSNNIYYAPAGYTAVENKIIMHKDEETSVEYRFSEVVVSNISTSSDAYKNGNGLKNGDILKKVSFGGKTYDINTVYAFDDIKYLITQNMYVSYTVQRGNQTLTIGYNVEKVSYLQVQN